MKNIDDIYELLRQIPVTKANKPYIDEIEDLLTQQEYIKALERMRQLKDVTNDETENEFIGILLSNPKLIMKYYFSKEICLFKDEQCLNIYKSILFNEGAKYASEKAKDGFNFSKESEEMLKNELLQCKQELHDTVLALSHSQKEQEVKSESYQHASDRILALETENKELQQKLTELTQELSKQKADADVGLQQCKAQAELTMERALFKKEREMQELLRQADKENARLEVLLEQAKEQLKKENIDKDEQ